MNKRIEFIEELEDNVIAETVRKVYLVGLGAASYTLSFAQDELTDWTSKLIEQGKKTDKKTREMVSKQRNMREKEVRKRVKRVESQIEERFESVLHSLNIPSKHDIDSLTKKINQLNKKVGELSKTA